jgi:hypothetical protein
MPIKGYLGIQRAGAIILPDRRMTDKPVPRRGWLRTPNKMRISRFLERRSWFDKLTTNGSCIPFALSLSKGELHFVRRSKATRHDFRLILICVKAVSQRLCHAPRLESAHALPGKEEP